MVEMPKSNRIYVKTVVVPLEHVAIQTRILQTQGDHRMT